MAGKSPLQLIHWVLSLGGMTVPPDAKYPRLVRLNCYTQAYNLVVFVITNLYQIFVSDEILEEKLGIGQHVLSSVHIGGKHFNILFRTQKIRHYLNEIEEMWKDATEGGKNMDLFEMADKSSYTSMVILTSAYVGLVPLIILICIFSNLFSDSSELSLPMKTWTPFSNYWVSSFYQLFSFHSVVLSVGISKSFERAIFLQINAQMKVMQRMLYHRRKDESDFNYKKMYKLHQRILKLVEETNYNFAGQAMLEMALSALQIAMRLSTCITALLGGKPTFAPYFLNLILAMIAPYIICLNGSIVTSEGENIYRTAYDNVWYEEKTKSSKDLLILQSMAIKPVELNYKVVFKFSLVQFTTLMQGSYSYLMMIKYFAEQNGI